MKCLCLDQKSTNLILYIYGSPDGKAQDYRLGQLYLKCLFRCFPKSAYFNFLYSNIHLLELNSHHFQNAALYLCLSTEHRLPQKDLIPAGNLTLCVPGFVQKITASFRTSMHVE